MLVFRQTRKSCQHFGLLYETHDPASAEAEAGPDCIMHQRLFLGHTGSHRAYVHF